MQEARTVSPEYWVNADRRQHNGRYMDYARSEMRRQGMLFYTGKLEAEWLEAVSIARMYQELYEAGNEWAQDDEAKWLLVADDTMQLSDMMWAVRARQLHQVYGMEVN